MDNLAKTISDKANFNKLKTENAEMLDLLINMFESHNNHTDMYRLRLGSYAGDVEDLIEKVKGK